MAHRSAFAPRASTLPCGFDAEAQKKHRDELLPIAPEFAEFLLAVPKAERHGLVFGIYGQDGKPLSTKRASRYIVAIGKAANVVTNKAEGRYATAHDLRRSFCTRWAKRVMPAGLERSGAACEHQHDDDVLREPDRPKTWATCCGWR